MNDKVWIDGPAHPDMFDGETPIRTPVNLEECGYKVFKVECTYYEPEKETHFIVAQTEGQAEEKAWEKICAEETHMDEADVTEMDLDQECRDFLGRNLMPNGETKTARQLLVEHFESD